MSSIDAFGEAYMPDDEPVQILIVNDRAQDIAALEAALDDLGETILSTTSPEEALTLTRERDIAVVILDICMPVLDGFEVAARLRADEKTRALPIIFVSALDPTAATLDRVYSLGAVDYLPSPVAANALRAKVAVFVELHRKNLRLARVAQSQAAEAKVQLRASDEQFRAIFDAAAVGHVIIDPLTKRYLRVNAHFCAMTGYSEAELLERTFEDITHPDHRAAGAAQFERIWKGELREIETEKRYVRKDGSTVWAQVAATLLRREDGSPWLHVSVIQDITARKRAERELMESRSQLHLAIEAAELGTFFNDLASNRLIHSERAGRLLGFRPGEIITTERFLAQVHADDRARVADTLQARRHLEQNVNDVKLEYRVVWPDGTIHHLVSASRVLVERKPDGTKSVQIVGTLRDVTAAREFEQELHNKVAARTAALEEKTAQLESFCYTVAHDLRSPLRAISGYADIVVQDFGRTLPPEGNEYMNKIKASAGRLDHLIKDLLAYSRITQVDIVLDDVPVQPSVDWALQQLQGEIVEKSAVVEVAAPLPRVRGERTVLDQVLLNLVSNALKFVPAGTAPRVAISAASYDSMVRLSVRDNGIGIPDTYHERIFRVFERLQQARDFPGTGVGLAIVAKAAERLGGRVGVDSEPGQGSTFWIELKKAEA